LFVERRFAKVARRRRVVFSFGDIRSRRVYRGTISSSLGKR
jgi:hypothetical protein